MNYRCINYPESFSSELKARYETLADSLETAATEPIAIIWAYEHEDWTDDNGVNPERDCLLVTQHIQQNDTEWSFGLNLSSHRLYNICQDQTTQNKENHKRCI
jgi:hypothetical protein